MAIFKTIAGHLLDWAGVANVPAALTALVGLKGEAGQIIEIGGVDAQGGVTELVAVDKPGGGADSGQNPSQGGLTTAQIAALDGMFRACGCAEKAPDAYEAFMEAFGISVEDIEQADNVLTIRGLATEPTQDGSVLTIA